jgi:hypothetical protein
MFSCKSITVGALAVFSILYSTGAAFSVPAANPPPKPPVNDRIQLPYARLFPSQLEVPKQSFRERILLKNDDGTAETRSIRSIGHAIKYQRPPGLWKLTGVIAYMGRTGHPEQEEGFKVHVFDTTGKSLVSVWRAKTKIRLGDPQWYMIDLFPCEVPEEFYVVDLKRQPGDRSLVYMGCDTSDPTSVPTVADLGTPGVYELNQVGKWMIRAVLSGDGNRPEDLIDARIIPDQVLPIPKKPDMKAYRAPDRQLKWLKQLPPPPPNTGRLDLSWDQRDVIVGIRYLGKRGSMIKTYSKSLTVDLPVSGKSVFEVSIMRPGYIPAIKRFTVSPGSRFTWSAELQAKPSEEEATKI